MAAGTRQQGILLGTPQVRDPDTGRVPLATCRTRGDHRLCMPAAMRDQRRLHPCTVDAVHDPVRRGQQAVQILPGDEIVDAAHLADRVDVAHASAQDLDLRPPQGAVQRRQLTVDVRLRDMVHIDQGQPADPAARQGLHRP